MALVAVPRHRAVHPSRDHPEYRSSTRSGR
ncbi:hypothetical protein HNQ83_29130 [Pseudomonas sp. C2B4]|nr:hypothetical protein [Pseudomonas sp. C2B4]